MTMDEKFKQAEDWENKINAELYEEIEPADRFVPYNRNEEVRFETIMLQLGIRKHVDYGCVTVMADDDELVDDYDLCAYFD